MFFVFFPGELIPLNLMDLFRIQQLYNQNRGFCIKKKYIFSVFIIYNSTDEVQ